jgi:hypothetical protein
MTQLMTVSAASAAGADATEASAPWPRPVYAWSVVAILLLVSICSYLDRQIISLVVEDIKHDLGCRTSRSVCCRGRRLDSSTP